MNGFNLAAFARARAGLLAMFAVVNMLWMGVLWATGLLSLPARVTLIETQRRQVDGDVADRLTATEKAIQKLGERMIWVVCTTIPPNTRNELRALRVDCGSVDVIMDNLK